MKSKLAKIITVVIVFIVGLLLIRSQIKSELKYLKKPLELGNIFDTGFLISSSSENVHFYSDSLRIAADLFLNKKNSPGIILLHGSSISGRKLELNRIIAQKFYESGFTVLAIDSRGYGDSDDPPHLNASSDFSFDKDIISATNYLFSNSGIDTSKCYIVGHSFGAGIALDPIVKDYRIKKAVLFGPPRRYSERFWGNDTIDRQYIINRKIRDMQLNYNLDFNVYKEVIRKQDIELFISKLNSAQKPIFLIDCENENQKDLDFLKKIYDSLTTVKDYWTVPGVDHYLNTGSFFNTPAYNKQKIDLFIERVTNWLRK